MEINKEIIENIVREILTEGLKNNSEIKKNIEPLSGILSVDMNTVKPEKFDTGKEGDQVYLKDILTLEESPRLGAGLMEMKETTFDWTLEYDEVDYIIEGTLEININGKKVKASAGNVIFIPKGSSIQFCVPDYAKFLYVTYPADWASQK
ncbi:cupin domain-containing protein [Oceanotoga sp. DSM 15011]|jgi:ethanolamine utilization protein EutQ|uniref:Ethanolamine utilization protein EutQ n=1 Tax=Oceanotoga teriensis TaxID=515440 RepID=A0AA45C858_9BACT|nr:MULTISPECIES: cupin domain-containing protein [Oceanotoga]MDN5341195.1 ethanolamine utilization protein EutQ [Oceanotoga sp.]MDO7976876.1 cupin domain-containing protein [Oceanotoga teriensis]PWJ95956.1 ethanolamine utilization protein EutQ [Oceanotoga teriensis]UYP00821.1 cupin domain-containing protein [Oceanotoga sp. DSM 15011]